MKHVRLTLVIVVGCLGACSSDSGTPPDSAAGKDGTPQKDRGMLDTSPATDIAKTDAAPKADVAKTDAAPKTDVAAKADGGGTCSPNPCQHGGTCAPTSSGFACTCTAGWKGTTCQTASYCDVVYRVTGAFHTTDAPLIGEFTKAVGTNAGSPSFNPARTTPFTPTAFGKGFMRLRFPNLAGAPAAGVVKIVEYYMPMEFSVTTLGTTVNTDVDHSAGMLQLGGTPQTIADPPVLGRTCGTVGSGTLTGTTLAWDTCGATPSGQVTWTFASAQSSDPGCLHRMSVWGNVNCSAGLCNLVPGTGNQRQTWDQKLNAFSFSSANLATATFTMAEIQTPNATGVKTYIALTATSVIKVECDTTVDPLSCDEQ
jgi:hypothetical protein